MSQPGLWERWVTLLERREAPTSLALIRILFGLVVAGHVARQWWGDPPLYWFDQAYGGLRHLEGALLIRWLGGASPEVVGAVSVGAVVSGLLMVVGWRTRLATFGAWLCFRSLGDVNGHAGGSYDEVIINVLFLLMLSGAGAGLSLDSRGRSPALVPAWPRWVIFGQLVLIYWTTALQKVSDSWVPGGELDALWFILLQPSWVHFDIQPSDLLPFDRLLQVSTLMVWLWEHAAPTLLLAAWFRATRNRAGWLRSVFNRLDWRLLYLMFGVAMHAGIEALMNVGPFSLATVSMYVACFHPDEIAAVYRRFTGRRLLR